MNSGEQVKAQPASTAPCSADGISAGAEQQLLARARAGDTEAFGRLVGLHQDRIYGLVVRMIRSREAAEELTQDVFVKAYRNLEGFRGESRISTWLYRIAVNLCRDHQTSRAARDQRLETSLIDPALGEFALSSRAPAPDQQLEHAEMAACFDKCLDNLDPTYREPFLLRHQEGRGHGEIAEILGISIANAKVRVHRAREMVLRELRATGYDV